MEYILLHQTQHMIKEMTIFLIYIVSYFFSLIYNVCMKQD